MPVTTEPGSSVEEVVCALATQYPALGRGWMGSVAVAVNEEYVDRSRRVNEGDAIALIPPVSGGAPCTV